MLSKKEFKSQLKKLCTEESKNMSHLLVKSKTPWSVDDDFVNEMYELADNLARQYMYRAYLFADHRTNGNSDLKVGKVSKKPLELKEADLYLAWETLNQDAHE